MSRSTDEQYMEIALSLARLGSGQTDPNPMVGAIVVKNGQIVGQGAHLYPGGPHAEVYALRMAGEEAGGSTVYVTLEPCSHYGKTPPCADALITAGVKRVVVACEDVNPQVAGRGIQRLRNAGIQVDVGVGENQAQKLNEGFFHLMKTGRPLVLWKSASTLDGYIATATGDSRYVTGEASRHQVQVLRSEIPAIAVGVGTVLADNPLLTVRLEGAKVRQPLRVVFDSTLRTPVSAQLLTAPGQTLIYATTKAAAQRAEAIKNVNPGNVEVVVLPFNDDGRVSLSDALKDLGTRGIHSLLLEGGSSLASEFLKLQLVHRVIFYVAPKILGGGIPVLSGLSLSFMRDAIDIVDADWQQSGDDICLRGRLVYQQPSQSDRPVKGGFPE